MVIASPVIVWGEVPQSRLHWVYPPGGMQGTETEVTIGGNDLDEVDRLIFTHSGITEKPKLAPQRAFEKEPRAVPNKFIVSIAANVPPGIFEVRASGHYGLSTPRAFEVGDLPEIVEQGDNHSLAKSLPISVQSVVNARSEPDSFDVFEFAADQGQRLIIGCGTRRIDSRMTPVMEILDASGKQLAFSRATHRREPLIDFTAPTSGNYRLKVYDAVYGGGEQYFYRLVLSTRPCLDFVFPPSGLPGTAGRFTLYGQNLPGGTPAQFVSGGDANFEQVTVDIPISSEPSSLGLAVSNVLRELNQIDVDGMEYRLADQPGPSNPRFISHAKSQVIIEQEPNDDPAKSQPLALPCEVVGQFFPRRDVDWFSFDAQKGKSYAIEVFSERLMLPTDPAVIVQHVSVDSQDNQTVRVVQEQDDITTKFDNPPFDAPSHDVAFVFVADADGLHRVQVRDLYAGSNAHPRNIYRMTIGDPQPDFRLVVTSRALIEGGASRTIAGSPTLMQGGAQPMLVQAYRRGGFDGPIRLHVEGLPANVIALPVEIGSGQQHASLVASATMDASPWTGEIKVVGTAMLNGQEAIREALPSSIVWDQNSRVEMTFARVTQQATLAVIPELAPVTLTLLDDRLWETSRAGKLTIPMKIKYRTEIKGNPKVEARGLPAEIKVAPVTLDAQTNDVKMEISVEPNAPPGDYPLYFVCQARGNYQRNPQAVVRVEEDKAKLNVVVGQLTEAAKAAEMAKADAETKVSELAAAGESAETADACAAAAETKAKAIESVKFAQDVLNAALEEQKVVDKRLSEVVEACKPKETELFAASRTLIIRVSEVPLNLMVIAPPVAIKSGEQGEISITAERLFGFAGPIDLETNLPAGLQGISVDGVQIAAEQAVGKLLLKANANVTPGVHLLTVRARLQHNGSSLQTERAVEVLIESAESK